MELKEASSSNQVLLNYLVSMHDLPIMNSHFYNFSKTRSEYFQIPSVYYHRIPVQWHFLLQRVIECAAQPSCWGEEGQTKFLLPLVSLNFGGEIFWGI